MLAVKILFGDNAMDEGEWRYFLAGPSGAIDVPPNPTDWLGELEWAEVYRQIYGAGKLPAFKGFPEYFTKNSKAFQTIFDALEPHNTPIPGEWNGKLTMFQKIIVLKALRGDKVALAI